MIVYEITRKNKPPQRTYGNIRDLNQMGTTRINGRTLDEVLEAQRERRQQQLADGEKPNDALPWRPTSSVSSIHLSKQQYTHWLDTMVVPRFPKGTIVSLRSTPIVLNQAPANIFMVIELQEIHYMASIDRETRDPCCVGLLSLNNRVGTDRVPVWYPPARLRNLQPEEMSIVNDLLRNQTHQNTNGARTGSSASADNDEGGSGRRHPLEEGQKEEGDI